MTMQQSLRPFTIRVDQDILDDLNRRLDATRWPNEPVSRPWQYGTDLAWMRDVATHWRQNFDWRRREGWLNRFNHYHADVQGQCVHFVLERGSGPHPLPLLLTHGWPGSFVEFLDVVDTLAHPERYGGDIGDAFTVVVPSLPGFGFSPAPPAPIAPRDIGALWSELMTGVLGFERYVAQGGDWGGIVTAWLALEHPAGLEAIHLNIAALQPELSPDDPWTAEELAWKAEDAQRRADLTGYRQIQGTRPQTLAYALTDSPIGLAAWILEKYHDWTNRYDTAPPPFELDDLLTNVMLYWLGGINAPNWMYVGLMSNEGRRLEPGRKVAVPTGFMFCPDDLGPPPPDRWLRRVFNMVHRRDTTRGGHFLALEQPDLFVDEMRRFFRPYRG